MPVALGLVAEVLTKPVFDETELSLARIEQGDRAFVRSHGLFGHLTSAVVEKIRGVNHCVTRSAIGHVAGIERFRKADVERLYRRSFGLAGTILVVVTERPTDEIVAAVSRFLPPSTEGEPAAPRPPGPSRSPPRRDRVVVLPGGGRLAYWAVGLPAPGRQHPDALPMALVAHVLGASSVSRANLALRHREGETYGVATAYPARADGGELLLASSCDTKDSVRSVRSPLAEAERLRTEPVTLTELEAARAQYLAHLADELSSPSGMALAIADLHAIGAPLDYYASVEARVADLRPEDLQAAAARWLDTSVAQVALAGQLAQQMVELEALGEIEVQRIREVE